MQSETDKYTGERVPTYSSHIDPLLYYKLMFNDLTSAICIGMWFTTEMKAIKQGPQGHTCT